MAVVFARETCVTAVDGERYRVTAGDAWEADHPLVKARPELFAPAPTRLNGRRVEEATARPGEKRRAK